MVDELKFSDARRKFKNLSSQKMRDNLYCTDDPALITKKFWSHVRFNSKSHRSIDCQKLCTLKIAIETIPPI